MSDHKPDNEPAFLAAATQVNFPAQEAETLRFWADNDVFRRSVEERPRERPFVFNDGPPFANGQPHYGHLIASIIKDVVPRYWTMRGYRVDRRFGWDCHGLPVENEAERQLELKSRRDILGYGVDRFNEACRGLVLRYTAEWRQIIERAGRWVDWDNQYRTMDPEFMESVWWVFKTLWDRGLVYEGYKSLAYCPRCATPLSNFEVNQGYQDTQDPSVTVRFRLRERDANVLAWTTTPWTLPSNMGLAIGPEIPYVQVSTADGERLILAKARFEALFGKKEDGIQAVEDIDAADLVGAEYEPLFPYFADKRTEGAFRVVAADFVSTEDGTGVVHIAPGFGEDDYQLGRREGLPTVCPIDEDCAFTAEITDYEGRFVKEVDSDIIRRLRAEGRLFAEGTIQHTYPFCWRCDTPLIYRTISTWFVNVEQIKDRMLAANDQICWVPAHIQQGRFGRWLEGARDWAISRNRYWGTPLPIWRDEESGEAVCIGSRAELEELSGRKVDDLHKHVIDDIEVPAPSGKGTLKRIPEVLDCWFESGSMPYAQNHYPFEDRERFESCFPADFISEGLDQTRGWFYTLTVLGAALFDKPAFKNCIVNGMLLAEDGRKMSKRLKNYPEPIEMLDTYGADALRLYLLNSPALKAEELRMSEQGIKESLRSVIIPLWNSYSFFVQYANVDGWTPDDNDDAPPANRLDRWILSALQTLVHDIHAEMEEYRLYRTVPAMVAFVEQLTNWYIRRSRRRFWKSEDDTDKRQAYATLHRVLVDFAKMLAPVLPFITETIYQNLVRRVDPQAPLSIHLCELPAADESLRDRELEEQMDLAARAVVLGRSLRAKHNIKTRQPLRRLFLLPPDERSRDELAAMRGLIADELNIKEIELVEDEAEFSQVSYKANFRALGPRFGKRMKEVVARVAALTHEEYAALKGGDTLPVADGEICLDDVEVQRQEKEGLVVAFDNNLGVGLDLQLDDALVSEGIAREFVNRVQNMRKDAGLDVSDRIRIWTSGDPAVEKSVTAHTDYIAAETLALDIVTGSAPPEGTRSQDWQVNDLPCSIAIAAAQA